MIGLVPELAVATVLVALTVSVHLLGLDLLMSLVGLHLRWLKTGWRRVDRLLVPLGIVVGLFVVHGLEIWLYAFAYRLTGMLPTLEQALYFSTSAYSTVGESGQMLPPQWRVVGVLEAINGMLLIGWSTAFLFQVLEHLMQAPGSHPLPRGAIARASPRPRGSGSGSPLATNCSEIELMQ